MVRKNRMLAIDWLRAGLATERLETDKTSARSPNLDALRAIAALLVLAAHARLLLTTGSAAPRQIGGVTMELAAAEGVWLFFALSGFLIAGPYLRALLDGSNLPAPAGFARRRVARILPAYWPPLIVMMVFVPGVATIRWWEPAVHALLLQGLVPGQPFRFFNVAWSLSTEAAFYVFVPVAAYLVRLRHRTAVSPKTLMPWLLVLWGASVGTQTIVTAWPKELGGWTAVLSNGLPCTLALFCPGMLLAVWLGSSRARPERPATMDRIVGVAPGLIGAAVALFVLAALATQRAPRFTVYANNIGAIASGLVLVVFLTDAPWVRRLSRLLAPLGIVSYGIYLWHWVIASLLHKHSVGLRAYSPMAWAEQAVLLAVLTIPVATLSWLCIERPALRRVPSPARRRAVSLAPVA